MNNNNNTKINQELIQQLLEKQEQDNLSKNTITMLIAKQLKIYELNLKIM